MTPDSEATTTCSWHETSWSFLWETAEVTSYFVMYADFVLHATRKQKYMCFYTHPTGLSRWTLTDPDLPAGFATDALAQKHNLLVREWISLIDNDNVTYY